MAVAREYAVGVTVVPLASAPERDEEVLPPDPGWQPETLPQMLPAERNSAQNAELLRQITAAEAMLAGLRVQTVMQLAAARPASLDRQRGRPGAAGDDEDSAPGPGRLEGVSEFFPDELALVLSCSRTAASKLADQCAALWEKLPATLAALDAGALDWSRARAIAEELGWKARATAPTVVAEVEAAVLPAAPTLSVRQLKEAVRRELTARDAAAADRRRRDAEEACDVTVRPVSDGVSELVARMPHELALACRRKVTAAAMQARTDGDDRPLGVLRSGVVADCILQPWDDSSPSVTAIITVDVPLAALTADQFLEGGSPLPPVFARPGSVSAPTGEVDGEPITATHVRRLLADLDAIDLRAPAGGSLRFAFTDDSGALLAVATDTELRAAARRGCVEHRSTGETDACGCPVLCVPAPVDRYEPTPGQVRYISTRDRSCRHPGCAHRAGYADADHVVPHAAGGRTACHNLCCLCRRHHRLKTHARGWRHRMTPDGVLTVTTPSGVTAVSTPDRIRRATAARSRAPDPPDLPLTTPRVLRQRPERPLDDLSPRPEDDPPPF